VALGVRDLGGGVQALGPGGGGGPFVHPYSRREKKPDGSEG
jgi:hypothetical protein